MKAQTAIEEWKKEEFAKIDELRIEDAEKLMGLVWAIRHKIVEVALSGYGYAFRRICHEQISHFMLGPCYNNL